MDDAKDAAERLEKVEQDVKAKLIETKGEAANILEEAKKQGGTAKKEPSKPIEDML